jgi:RNA methyltransferase, TrmH family
MRSRVLTSNQNPKIKFAVSLQKASARKKEGLFLIEGLREIRLAMLAGYQFHTLFFCPAIAEKCCVDSHGDITAGYSDARDVVDLLTGQAQIIEVTKAVFAKIAYREGYDGLLGVARQKSFVLEDIRLASNPLVLVAESVEKPGNLGAMFRTADAAGVDAVIVCDSGTDIFNPNVVRSSLGTLFTVPVVCCLSQEAIGWLKSKNIKIHTTDLTASKPYYSANFKGPSAVVSGAEATGVSAIWEENSDENIIIPMFGRVDSMNVSVATSIVLYEALRQRGFDSGRESRPGYHMPD